MSESDPDARRIWESTFSEKPPSRNAQRWDDMIGRDSSRLAPADFYACGIPCVSLSSVGKRDANESIELRLIQEAVLEYLVEHRPRLFFLENVPMWYYKFRNNLLEFLAAIAEIKDFDGSCLYRVRLQILDAKVVGGCRSIGLVSTF